MKVKLGISAILAVLAFIFIAQNTEPVMVDFMVWSVEAPVALLVFIILGAGIAIGWLLSSYLRFARNRKRSKAQASEAVMQEKPGVASNGGKESDE